MREASDMAIGLSILICVVIVVVVIAAMSGSDNGYDTDDQ